MIDSYQDQIDPSVYFRCPITDYVREYFLVWTTTPWTLTSNTALAIHPEMDYVRVRLNGDIYYLLATRAEAVLPKNAERLGMVHGSKLLGLGYTGPFDELPAQARIYRRTIPWDAISTDEGTGIVHIAPGCGAEDFELGKKLGLDTIVPIDDNGYFMDGFSWLTGKHVTESAVLIREDLQRRGILFAWDDYAHRYPICWRCKTPLVFRLVDEWFISCTEVRKPMKREASKVQWIPEYSGSLMQNWLDNMGDWCISRRRFWGLPLPFYICGVCHHRTVVGTKAELRERALNPEVIDMLPELHRPWIDAVKISCSQCGVAVERVTEVGDCWLDAGIVPYSTLNYLPDHLGVNNAIRSIRSEEVREGGQSAWRHWFPADFITEMREQVRLWFYSMLFMSVTLENKAPYLRVLTYEEMRDENNSPFSKSGGNAIPFDEAAEKMGADPMRWLYATAPLNQVFRFGYGPADEVKRRMLTLWHCYKFFVEYANLDKPTLAWGSGVRSQGSASELDRWILARLQELIAQCNDRLEHFDTATVAREVEKFIDDLSTWYVRQSRRRFWKSEDDTDKAAAYQTLYDVLVTLSLLIAPLLPFTAEELYQNLVRCVDTHAPESVHLCAYPQIKAAWQNEQLVEDIAILRRVVSLALSARNAANVKVRQPLLRLLVKSANMRERDVLVRMQGQVVNELNIKQLEFIEDEAVLQNFVVKLNFTKLGPKFGKRLPSIQQALSSADAQEVGVKVVAGEPLELNIDSECIILAPEDLIVERRPTEGLVVASDNGTIVALDTKVSRELLHEGMARDFVRYVQDLRKRADFKVSDRIIVHYQVDGEAASAITRHAEYIRQETLADVLSADDCNATGTSATFILGGQPVRVSVVRSL